MIAFSAVHNARGLRGALVISGGAGRLIAAGGVADYSKRHNTRSFESTARGSWKLRRVGRTKK